jgi:hypothetical protein
MPEGNNDKYPLKPTDEGNLRPFSKWSINYVRRMLAEGRMTREQAVDFRDQFRDGLKLEELFTEGDKNA